MFQKVFRDYIGAFRPGRMKKIYKSSAVSVIWLYTYLLILYPPIIDIGKENNGTGLFRYYTAVIPVLFGIFTLTLVEIRLPKQMLLCPLDEKERKKYLYETFAIRLFMPELLGAAACALFCVWNGSMDLKFILTDLFAVFSILLNSSLTVYPGSVCLQNDKKQKEKRIKDERLKGLVAISGIGIFIAILLVAEETVLWDTRWQEWCYEWIPYGIAVGVLLLFDLLVFRYLKPIVDIAADYEKSDT